MESIFLSPLRELSSLYQTGNAMLHWNQAISCCACSDCFAVDIFEIMQGRICAVWWKEWAQTFKVTLRLVMKTHTAQRMCLGIDWRQCCVQSNYCQEWQFPVQTSSDCIYSKGISESRGLFNFWYTLMTFATFPAGKISRRQEHSLEMAVSCPQWNCTCWVQKQTRGEECPTFGAFWSPLHLCLKGKKADRSAINQGLRKQDCEEIYIPHLYVQWLCQLHGGLLGGAALWWGGV